MKQTGIMLSGATTIDGNCQLLREAEGDVREGMLLMIKRAYPEGRLLARIGEIRSYNDFFTVGDAWTESRREGLTIPSDIARRYQLCRLDLLSDITAGINQITFPPSPGDKVYPLDPETNFKDIFGVEKDGKGLALFGNLLGYRNIPVPLDVENIPMHMAIFGITGSGKSYDTGVLMEKLLNIRQTSSMRISYPLVIVDAHGDYSNYPEAFNAVKENPDNKETWVGAAGFFKRLVFPHVPAFNDSISEFIEPIAINLDLINHRDIAELVIQFYRGEGALSEYQVDGLANVLEFFKDKRSMNILFQKPETLIKELNKPDSKKDLQTNVRYAIIRAIKKFSDTIEGQYRLLSTKSSIKDSKFVDTITRQQGVAIFDFSADGAPGVDLATKQIVIAYLATLLLDKFTEYKTKRQERYLIFMIEEAQNFCPSRDYNVGSNLAKSRLSAIATQGRKFGLSLCLITQRPAFVDSIVLSMCNSFFIHRISPADVSFVRSVTGGLPESIARKLTSMTRGDMIINGMMTKVPYPLLVSIPPERAVPHTAGTTNVVDGIAGVSNYESD